MSAFEVNDLASILAQFAKGNSDIDYTHMTNKIVEFLKDVIMADGKFQENEERALEKIEQTFQTYAF